MAAINFPSSPSNGDTHVVDGVTYTYNSAETKWKTTINSNAFLPLSGGNVTGNLTVRQDGTGQNIQVWQSDLGVNDRNLALLSPSSDSASEPFTFSTGNSLAVQIDASEAVRIDSSGRVGIGTPSPSKKLHVNGGQVLFQETAAASNAVLRLKGSSTSHGGALIAQSSSDGTAPLQFWSGSTQTAEIDSSSNLKFNSGYGSVATAYAVRAFVKFNGKGTLSTQILRGVSSVTDNGTGNYTVNFSFTMPDAHYAVAGSACVTVNSQKAVIYAHRHGLPTTTTCRIATGDTGFSDSEIVTVAFIR